MFVNLFTLNYSNSVLFAIFSGLIFAIHTELLLLSPDFYNFVAFTSFIVFITFLLKDTVSNFLETSYLEENALLTKTTVDTINSSVESVLEEVALVEVQSVLTSVLAKTTEKATSLHSLNFADQLVLEYSANTAIYNDLLVVLSQYISTQRTVFNSFCDKISKKGLLKK